MTTVALVAAKNAASRIGDTVVALRALRGVDEVWVVDDGSDDATADAATAAGAHVVRLPRNRGKGGALAAGVEATPHASRYLLADADLGATAAGLQPLLDAAGDFVVGVLPSAEGRGGFGTVKRVAAAGIRRATRTETAAPLSGQRLVDAALLRSLALAPRFGVEVGMTIDLLRGGAALREVDVDVDHEHRGRGLSGFSHRGRQGLDVLSALAGRLFTPAQQIASVMLGALLLLGLLTAVSQVRRAPSGAALPRVNDVVVFAIPRVGLEAFEADDRPNLRLLAQRGAVGAISVRTPGEDPSLADAYASLGASARVLGRPDIGGSRAQASADHADSLPGSLGDALRAAGKKTAVVRATPSPAVSALWDRRGRVDVVLDAGGAAFRSQVGAALARADVTLVAQGATEADARLEDVVLALPNDALLMVVGLTPPGQEWELTPLVLVTRSSDRRTGIASATTRRAGLGGLVDVAPTVLTALGIEPPSSMTGAPLRLTANRPDVASLERLQEDGAVRNRFFLPAAVGYTVAAVAAYLAFVAALRVGVHGVLRRVLRLGVCALAAFPLTSFVIAAAQHWGGFGGESPAALVVVSLALGAVAARLRGIGPVYALAAVTLAVIVIDVAATGPLHAAGILGYSLQTTGRYYGLPNASFAIYTGCLLLVAAAVAGWAPNRVRATAGAAVVVAGVAFVAAPWLGNDVGGTLTLLPLALAMAWAWFGHRFTVRVIAVGAALAAAAFVALVVLQALGGEATHLGRAATSDASFGDTLARRAEVNFGLLVEQWWGFLSIALAVGSLALLWRPERFADYLPARSGLRVASVAILVASLLGFVLNDSGPVVNVLCLVVLAPALALSSLERSRRAIGPAAAP